MTSKFELGDYVEVSERIQQFRERFPEGTLHTEIVPVPDAFSANFIAVRAYAYRTADDARPGTDMAWEPVPGKTPYTKDSELMNACTSAIGRAIIAVGVADTKRGIASAEEVRNRSDASASEAKVNRVGTATAAPSAGGARPSDKQRKFLLTLMEDRDVSGIELPNIEELDKRGASQWIDRLAQLPEIPKAARGKTVKEATEALQAPVGEAPEPDGTEPF